MTRIAYRQPEEMTEQARELTLKRGNLNVYRALANAEKVFTGWMLAGQAALTSPVLPVRLRELVVLRTASLMDCPYELGQHRDVARTAGLSGDEINAVASESDLARSRFQPCRTRRTAADNRVADHAYCLGRTVRSSAHSARFGGHCRAADGDQPLRRTGADAQRAASRPRRNRPAADPAKTGFAMTTQKRPFGSTGFPTDNQVKWEGSCSRSWV